MTAKLPRGQVEEVLAGAGADWAQDAEAAWDWITASGDLEEISLHDLQTFLWYQLPAKWAGPADRILRVAEALGRLLDGLGHAGYAEVCRSETTSRVLAAWAGDRDAGYAEMNRALGKTGVEPPDTDGFRWGEYMGIEEARLRLEAAIALEAAIDAGELAVGARGWRGRQRHLFEGLLRAPHLDHGGRTPLEVIEAERVDHWLNPGRGQRRHELIAPVAALVLEPVEPPAGLSETVRPLLRLLELARASVRLTEKGYLAPAVVRDLVDEFGWWVWRGTPRSESEVVEVHELHELARKAKLVRRSRRTLVLTPKGRRSLDDPARCWQELVRHLASGDAFMGALAEVTFAALLRGPADRDELEELTRVALEECGWKERGSDRLGAEGVSWSLADLLRQTRLFGFVETGDYPDRSVRLAETGRPTAVAVLRERATGPRTSL